MKRTAIRYSFLIMLILPLFAHGQASMKMSAGQVDAARWIETRFARGKVPPFSFVYGDKSSKSLLPGWNYSMKRLPGDDPDVVKYLYTYTERPSGLKVECFVTGFPAFDAVEWVLHFTNTGKSDSRVLEQVKVVDLDMQAPAAGDFTLYYADGNHISKEDFHPRTTVLSTTEPFRMAPEGGRSSQGDFLPFFNLTAPSGKEGVVVGIGWTGMWYADLTKTGDRGATLVSGMKTMRLYLHPDESIRTPSISLMFWNGDDRMAGHNRFRRFVLAHHTRKVDGQMQKYPLCSGFNYRDPAPCTEYSCLTADWAIAMVKRYKQFGLVPEVFWLDAGWHTGAADYKDGKSWANTTGNWTVDTTRFPDGLKPVADAVHETGAKFMVWFEPERVIKGTQWAVEHPDWMLDLPSEPDGTYLLFDLGNKEAREWLCRYIGDLIERNGIDYYRQDFNMEPDKYWAAHDEAGRTGMKEIRHVEGLYAFWDYLLERFPGLLIDNCASGGRRIDLESVSRSAPLWRTDYNYGEPVGYQCHTYGLEMYLPQHGTGVQKTDKFTFRSSLGTSVVYNWKITNGSSSFYEIQDCMKEFREVRPYFYEDYYPLTGSGDITGDNIWMAYQLYRPSDKSGFVVAFRREACPDKTHTVKLSGLDPDAVYSVTNKDTGETVSKSGRELAEGFVLTLDQPRSSLLLKYQAE